MQAELQRNFSGLKKETVPPYYVSYTVHDTTTSSLYASFGAIERNDQDHQRVGSVEVRVGELHAGQHASDARRRQLDPTCRPRESAAHRRRTADSRRALARDRSRVQAGLGGAHAGQDQRVRAPASRRRGARSRLFKGSAADLLGPDGVLLARHERVAGTASTPFRRIRGRPARAERRGVALMPGRQPLLRQQRRQSDRRRRRRLPSVHSGGHQGRRRDGSAVVRELLRAIARRAPRRKGARVRSSRHARTARAAASRAARRSLLGSRDPVGPGRGRVLPRDLRPPRRRTAPEERGRWADVCGQGRSARAAVVPERRVRSHASQTRIDRAHGLLQIRRRGRRRASA